MGIRGLTTFIDANPHLLSSHCLSNSQVVIDGNNLAHILYHDSGVDCFYGGDYDVYYKETKRYFAIFKSCNITPFIIFDGGYDSSNRKLKTTLERNIDRLRIACFHSNGQGVKRKLFPIMASEVFRDVLIDMEIPFVQCDFEADDQIAALANHFNCPVLSLDSDFYIFDLKGGFIPLNSIDTSMKKKKADDGTISYFLDCKIYYIHNLLQYFQGLDKSVLPLFGTLLGNDFVNINTFSQFFDKIKLPKIKSKKLRIGQRQKKMIGLLCWLQSRTVEEAIEQIVGFMKANDRERIKQIIIQTIEGYTKCKSTLLQALGIGDAELERKPYHLITKDGRTLPNEFSELFFQAVLPPYMLNAIGLQRIFLLSQVESIQAPSSYTTALYIRKIIYSMLLSKETKDINERIIDPVVTEYDRVNYNLKKQIVLPQNYLPKFGKLPTLEDTLHLSKGSARQIISEVLDVDEEFDQFPVSIQLPLIIIKYWACNSEPQITEHHVNSVIVCLLYLMISKQPNNDNDTFKNKDNIQQTISLLEAITLNEEITEKRKCVSATSSILKIVKNNLHKFFQKTDAKQKHHLDSLTLHGFSQFQTCLLFTSYLNRLLCFPFPHIQIEFVFSGTFLYQFCKELEKRPNPPLFISEMLCRDSTLDNFFCKIRNFMLQKIPKGKLLEKRKINTRRRKKNKKAPNIVDQSNNNSMIESDTELPLDVKMVKKFQSHVALENSFQELLISENSDTSVEFENLSD